MRWFILILSVVLSIAIIAIGLFGIFNPTAYALETQNWQVQAKGQDIINTLVIIPLLLTTAIGIFLKRYKLIWVWAGLIFYLLYTFVIYCFSVHFNSYFLLYCAVLGLTFYAFVFLLKHLFTNSNSYAIQFNKTHRATAIYLLILGVLFYFLWLSSIIPASVNNTVPVDLVESGLFTNPIHVIDIAILLPAFIITGVYLLRKKNIAVLLGIAFLTFTIAMNITIGFLAYYMVTNNVADDISVLYIMAVLTVLSTLLLYYNMKVLKIEKPI